MRLLSLVILAASVAAAFSQVEKKVQIDQQTGRAIGAKEITPEDLKKHIDGKTKLLIIDVREAEAFEKETIKGAINIPLGQLEGKFKDIPKDTTLVFT